MQKRRLAGQGAPTQKLAATPARFDVETFPPGSFVVISELSSGRRLYLPIGFEELANLCSNLVRILPEVSPYPVGILSSLINDAAPSWQGRQGFD